MKKRVGIIANHDRDLDGAYLLELVSWLNGRSIVPLVNDESRKFMDTAKVRSVVTDRSDLLENCDFCIVLGGDGTILRAAKTSSVYNTPLIGINLGMLGYLTDTEKCGGLKSVENVLSNRYRIERRMMLSADIVDERGVLVNGGLLALNDVCLLRGPSPRIKSFSLHINGLFLDRYKADGIIIATPTGSTAYNLSAGGPVLKPDIEVMAITPVCPHNMHARPLVVSGSDRLTLSAAKSHGFEVVLTLDGQDHITLESGQTVRVEKSNKYLSLIKTGNMGFYETLREKMK